MTRPALINLLAKAALVALLALSLVPDAPQFAGKAMGARALTYPLAALLVPVVWWARRRPRPYPHGLDLLVVLPFLVDVGGNVAGLYATRWFDDAAHLVNWAFLATAAGLVFLRLGVGRVAAAALALGAGSVSHTLWEIVEWGVGAPGLVGRRPHLRGHDRGSGAVPDGLGDRRPPHGDAALAGTEPERSWCSFVTRGR